jgi:hypothetical protein
MRVYLADLYHPGALETPSPYLDGTLDEFLDEGLVIGVDKLAANVRWRIRLDHGYSSLASGRGRLYEHAAYVYRD